MSRTITISLPDDTYQALEQAGADKHQTPEELAAIILNERFGGVRKATAVELAARDRFIAEMRARGVFTDPKSIPPYPGIEDLPPRGSPEWQQLMNEIGEDLSDAIEQTGLSIPDLIERR